MNRQQIIGFHNPDEEYGYLSNWYRSDFEKDGIRFSSMGQYMMYQKALCFRDEKIAAEVLKTDDVGRIKELMSVSVGFHQRQIFSRFSAIQA